MPRKFDIDIAKSNNPAGLPPYPSSLLLDKRLIRHSIAAGNFYSVSNICNLWSRLALAVISHYSICAHAIYAFAFGVWVSNDDLNAALPIPLLLQKSLLSGIQTHSACVKKEHLIYLQWQFLSVRQSTNCFDI